MSTGDLTFTRLSTHDAPEVASFLNEVWGSRYGPTGAPVYTPDYLRWLYGGPDQALHLVTGGRVDGRLVALRALLHRPAVYRGEARTAYLATHLALHPDLGPPLRGTARNRIFDSTPLRPSGAIAADLMVSFYEKAKRGLIERIERQDLEHGIGTSLATFQQAVVSPAALRARLLGAEQDATVRPVADADIAALAALFNRVAARQPFAFTTSADRLQHLLGVPGGRGYVAEERGAPSAFIVGYPMDVRKAAGISRVVVVEFLITEGARQALCLLLERMLALAESVGARGAVIENPTYIDADTQRDCGIVPSTRAMVLAVRSRGWAFACDSVFLCDVK